AANPRRLTGLDRDRHTGFLTARVHPVNVTSPDVDLDPVGIGKRVAGDLAFGVGVGCAAPAIDGGSWPDSADLLDLEEAGLDDDLKLFEHGEERVVQLVRVGGVEVEPAASIGDALQGRLLVLREAEAHDVGRDVDIALGYRRRGITGVAAACLEAVGDEDDGVDLALGRG